MSANLAVINFAVGGSLAITGKTTLSETIKSSSSGEFVGLTTTTLAVTGSSTFNSFLPTSTQTPTTNSQLTTKVYVDTADGILNTRITTVDGLRKTYVDDADGVLNTRITTVDSSRKTYIDAADTLLNTRITDTDAAQRTYIDTLRTKPIFYVNQLESNAQTIPNNAMSKILYTSSQYNVFTRYTNSEYLFRPTLYPGYYQLNATVCLPNITSGYIAIFRNGIEYSRGTSFSSTATSPNTTLTVSAVMYMSGSTIVSELTEADVRVICSPSVVVSGGSSKTFFTGNFIQL